MHSDQRHFVSRFPFMLPPFSGRIIITTLITNWICIFENFCGIFSANSQKSNTKVITKYKMMIWWSHDDPMMILWWFNDDLLMIERFRTLKAKCWIGLDGRTDGYAKVFTYGFKFQVYFISLTLLFCTWDVVDQHCQLVQICLKLCQISTKLFRVYLTNLASQPNSISGPDPIS